jgi:tryptophanyl-tRNA synthetase
MTRRHRALSGIKPTGTPHLGNLYGMILPAIALQETHDVFYFVADYHALTTGRDAAKLRHNSNEITATFLALGLDPTRSTLFRQSDVPEVVELAWLLACVTGIGLLQRAHAYKAAVEANALGELSLGTFYYPVLMAADILLYDADVVPVGRDQVQHVEMAQDMAGHLNAIYGSVLHRPEALVRAEVAVVPGLDGRKMSKSYNNTIPIIADTAKAYEKLAKLVVTDSRGVDDPVDPDTCTVYQIYKLVAEPAEAEAMAAGLRGTGYGYGHAKVALGKALEARLGPVRERYQSWMARPDDLRDVLDEGARKARVVAREVLGRTREKVGLPPR